MTKPINRVSLRTTISAMPESAHFHMLLGIDGDSDFCTGHVMHTCHYQGSKEELLALIDSQTSDELPIISCGDDFLSLGRRHAVLVEDIANSMAS